MENRDVRCVLVVKDLTGPRSSCASYSVWLRRAPPCTSLWWTSPEHMFNVHVKCEVFVELPPEADQSKDVVGQLPKCMYGTRDAA